MSATIALSRVHYPVRALGFGRRVGIWLQGCSIRCAGCIVPETWDACDDDVVPVAALFASIVPWLHDADGVTISGGEPFDQPVALAALLADIRATFHGDILVYSGYSERRLRERFANVLDSVDAVISEPFREDLIDQRPYVGSSNQRLLVMSELGERRNAIAMRDARRRDMAVRDGEILMAGVPRRHEMAVLGRDLRDAGLAPSGGCDAV